MIIRILLGDALFESMLSKSFLMEYPSGCPFQQYQFERYFVLAITLLGNLAQHLVYDIKMLFQQNLKFLKTSLKTSKVKGKLHQQKFIPMIHDAAKASTTREILMIVCKIQQLHYRNIVTFDFNNNCFKTVLPDSFQSFPLYSKVTNIQTHKDPVFV